MSKFDAYTINGYTRKYALSMSLPKVKRVEFEEVKLADDWNTLKLVNVLESQYLPPHSDFLLWRRRLRDIEQDLHPYISSNHGNFVLDTVEQAIKLYDAKDVRDCVSQEVIWFRNPPKRPHSVSEYPPVGQIDRFRTLISDTPCDSFVENLHMKPGELARLAHTRYISSDHVQWFANKINSVQKHSLCVYLNGVKDIQKYISDNFTTQTNLSFILNVGKDRSGRVFYSDDSRPGCHWALINYDHSSKTLIYGDSLGWSAPDNITAILLPWLAIAFKLSQCPDIVQCHDSTSYDSAGRHVCNTSCTHYPLQTCSNICGPVSVTSMVITAFSNQLFRILTSTTLTTNIPFLYLKEPTKYGKYLRQVLMAWIASDSLNVRNIVPQEYLRNEPADFNDVASDSDEDLDVITMPVVASSVQNVVSTAKTDDKRFHCTVCDSSYTRKNDLKRHMTKSHQLPDSNGDKIDEEIIDYDIDLVVNTLKKHLSNGKQIVDILQKVKDLYEHWQCTACETVKYVNMIECDRCSSWFHWDCVSGGEEEPSSATAWFCAMCMKQPYV